MPKTQTELLLELDEKLEKVNRESLLVLEKYENETNPSVIQIRVIFQMFVVC